MVCRWTETKIVENQCNSFKTECSALFAYPMTQSLFQVHQSQVALQVLEIVNK